MPIIPSIHALHGEMTRWRQAIHASPELGFEEHVTSRLVAGVLAEAGYEVHTGIGGTGVVGRLRNGGSTAAVGLRADMDALPIDEETDLSYRSTRPGVMHACGHDGHTAMLLGAAVHLARTRAFDGIVNIIFQPAEEGCGGAAAMIGDGLFERFPCDAIYAMHNKPGLAAGRFGIFPGPMMAGGALFEISIEGRSSHAARPDLGVDPIVAAAQIIGALQTVVSRSVDPRMPAVVSVSQIHGGDAFNVIPKSVHLKGTARCFSRSDMALIEKRLREIVSGVAAANGVKADTSFVEAFPPLINDCDEAERAFVVCCELAGSASVDRDLPLIMASEDFALMLEHVPGCYVNIGNGLQGHPGGCDVHNGKYDFNDVILPLGASFFAAIAERRLRDASTSKPTPAGA